MNFYSKVSGESGHCPPCVHSAFEQLLSWIRQGEGSYVIRYRMRIYPIPNGGLHCILSNMLPVDEFFQMTIKVYSN